MTRKKSTKKQTAKPVVQLLGQDGNAYMILGLCLKAARKAGWPQDKIDAVMADLKGGDYDHLLMAAQTHFEVT